MRHQTITVAVPDGLQWRKGDRLGGAVVITVVDAAEPVEIPKRIGIDFTLSFDALPGVAPGETLADDIATWIMHRVHSPGSPLAWAEERSIDLQILGQATYTP